VTHSQIKAALQGYALPILVLRPNRVRYGNIAMSHPQSRLPEILNGFYNRITRLDDFERRLDERAARLRRRIANVLDHVPVHRHSHLRVFITHDALPVKPEPDTPNPDPPTIDWTLQIEGKLLVGHLDYASAAAHDARVGFVPPTDDLDRSKAEKEEEELSPVDFTHLFEKANVEFQTVYMPRPNPMAAAKPKTPTKKSSRRATKSPSATFEEKEVDPRTLSVSQTAEFCWERTMSADALAFHVRYTSPPPPAHSQQIHAAIAHIQLYPNVEGQETTYQVSKELAEALFPSHGPGVVGSTIGTKRKIDEVAIEIPCLENEIEIPSGLTMSELIQGFFTYVQDRNLCDDSDMSTIVCDEALQQLFEVDRIPFSQIQVMLVTKNLIRNVSNEPVRLKYILRPDQFVAPSHISLDSHLPAQLQLDMDVNLPAFFPYRARELKRRIKRRELEYTSSRTKARYILMARRSKNEETVKQQIEQAVTGHIVGRDMIPILAALAKAAPPHTEARLASHLDAKISFMFGQAEEHQKAAQDAWNRLSILEGTS
jgi:hypothetical protein